MSWSCRHHSAWVLLQHSAALERFGLDLEDFGGGSVRLSAVPALLDAAESEAAVRALAEDLDWNLGKRGDITKIALARELGLDGIQVSLTFPTDGSPHLRQPETQVAFKRAALEHGVQICSLAIGNPGKSRLPFHTNPASAILLVEAVEVARNIGTTNILLPILGDSHIDMTSQAQVDTFVAMMKEVARYAEKAGVVVGLEDWISAEDNLRAARSRSDRTLSASTTTPATSRRRCTTRTASRRCSAQAHPSGARQERAAAVA